jgi:DNA mismatch repair protein MutS2
MIEDKVLTALELDKVLSGVKKHLTLGASADILGREKPADSFEQLKYNLDLTKEADVALTAYNTDPVSAYDKIGPVIEKAAKQITLTIAEILKIARLYKSSRLFKTKITEAQSERLPILKQFAGLIVIDKDFERECARCFVSEEQVSDNASEKLKSIRKKIAAINEKIKDSLNSLLFRYGEFVQENYVTIRSGRYVIPVKAEHKNKIRGLLHDQSSTGATVFIEPEQVVAINNELKSLQISENEEIERILGEFTEKVRLAAAQIASNNAVLIKADIAFAKARYAHATKAVMPLINDSGHIDIIGGRHPLIDEKTVVPITLSLGKDYNLLIISGPNTGGKTVSLKLCGLFCVMAMCGLFLPAKDGTEISFFEKIFCDIGDEQSIENSLSTFSSHMKNIISICRGVDEKSLALIDEIGAGTDPSEGAALALAIVEHLLEKKCKGIITTHYGELKEYALLGGGIKNAGMEFDPVNLKPTYKLNIGIPGTSNALEISKNLGLDGNIISKAYKNLSGEKIKFEEVLKSAEKARKEAEANLEETLKIKNEYKEKLAEVEKEAERIKNIGETALQKARADAKRLYGNAVTESEELINTLKELIKSQNISEADLFEARRIKKQLEDKTYSIKDSRDDYGGNMIKADPENISAGQRVFIKSLASVCEIVNISKNKKEILTTHILPKTWKTKKRGQT